MKNRTTVERKSERELFTYTVHLDVLAYGSMGADSN